MQNASGDRGPVTARAMHGDPAVARDLADPLLQVVQRNIHASFNVMRLPFGRIPHIDQHGRVRTRQLLSDNWGADAFGRPDEIRPASERFHSSAQVALYVIEPDAA